MVRTQIDQTDVVTSFVVYPTAGTDPETLAATINDSVEGVKATGPSAFQDQIASTTQVFNTILYGIAIISLIVGGLSVINTMTMSVSERTREIGVRKAIGASDGQIVRQFLSEAGVIGLIGGVSGLALGWIAATVVNAALASSNLNLFLVTPRLAIGAVAFALVLGVVSGLYPSLHAARHETGGRSALRIERWRRHDHSHQGHRYPQALRHEQGQLRGRPSRRHGGGKRGRDGGHHGTVRLRQVDLAPHPRLPRLTELR